MGKLTSILAAGALITSPEAMADQPVSAEKPIAVAVEGAKESTKAETEAVLNVQTFNDMLIKFGYTAEQVAVLQKEFGIEGMKKATLLGKKDPGLHQGTVMMLKFAGDPEKYAKFKTYAETQLEPDVPLTKQELAALDAEIARLDQENQKLREETSKIAQSTIDLLDPSKK